MIRMEHVSAGYQKKMILQDISFSFYPNSITGIIGPNGCGKTTLLKTAAGLLTPAQGKVLLDERELSGYSRKELARQISFLPQIREIPAISVAGLVMHGRFPYLGFPRVLSETDRRIAEQSMKQAGVWDFHDRMLTELSGGERQKAYFAQLLAQDAQTVFLDEPTTYLDIRHQLELLMLTRKIMEKGKTVVMVLHDLVQALSCCDYLLLMEKGKILSYQNPEELYKTGKIEEIFQVSIECVKTQNRKQNYIISAK